MIYTTKPLQWSLCNGENAELSAESVHGYITIKQCRGDITFSVAVPVRENNVISFNTFNHFSIVAAIEIATKIHTKMVYNQIRTWMTEHPFINLNTTYLSN